MLFQCRHVILCIQLKNVKLINNIPLAYDKPASLQPIEYECPQMLLIIVNNYSFVWKGPELFTKVHCVGSSNWYMLKDDVAFCILSWFHIDVGCCILSNENLIRPLLTIHVCTLEWSTRLSDEFIHLYVINICIPVQLN